MTNKDILPTDHRSLPHLLMLLASRVGGLLNREELARTVKLTAMTLRRYLDLLRTLLLIHLLPAWSSNLGKRLVKSSKIYFTDTALQLFLLNINTERLLNNSHLLGIIKRLSATDWFRASCSMGEICISPLAISSLHPRSPLYGLTSRQHLTILGEVVKLA